MIIIINNTLININQRFLLWDMSLVMDKIKKFSKKER